MMTNSLKKTLESMTDMQRKAVEWDDGSLLVLAGPGSGKTRVLTCRIARLLESSPNERFRVLGLTFTNKAAHEMRTRVAKLAPDAMERAEINTFHGFCAQLLRQHGVHCGVKPNFEIYSLAADRQAVLADALRYRSDYLSSDDNRILLCIDELKKRLVSPEQAASYLRNNTRLAPDIADSVERAYQLYEKELSRVNALDFNSLIGLALKLLDHPMLARHYRTIYRYWLIDEFQDTNGPQYQLLRRMAGDNFRQLFTVADDDQTIYEWNGANVGRIRGLVEDFGCEVIQITHNFRCPASIVEAANRLVVYNVRRNLSKAPAVPAALCSGGDREIEYSTFSDERDEALHIAAEVSNLDAGEREETIVLARSRALLDPVQKALVKMEVPVALLGRRDDFVSPQMRWLVACLKQINRPLDRRNITVLVETFRSFVETPVEIEEVVIRSEMDQVTPLPAWFAAIQQQTIFSAMPFIEAISDLASGITHWTEAIEQAVDLFKDDEENSDLKDDLDTWYRMQRKIRRSRGTIPLDQFLQEMAMRSKEPMPGAVRLSTIHGAKGLEFDRVYLMGLAEEVFPSWHSTRKRNGSASIEEERRSCFVAITRAKKRLSLSRAKRYKGRPKEPSRFLEEMSLRMGDSDKAFRREGMS